MQLEIAKLELPAHRAAYVLQTEAFAIMNNVRSVTHHMRTDVLSVMSLHRQWVMIVPVILVIPGIQVLKDDMGLCSNLILINSQLRV